MHELDKQFTMAYKKGGLDGLNQFTRTKMIFAFLSLVLVALSTLAVSAAEDLNRRLHLRAPPSASQIPYEGNIKVTFTSSNSFTSQHIITYRHSRHDAV